MLFYQKGQVTIFVIVAIVVVLGIVGVSYFFGALGGDGLGFDSKVGAIKNELGDCFLGVYKDSLDLVGVQGGHYNFPSGNYNEDVSGIFLSYYKDEDGVYLPSLGLIENELGVAVDSTIDYCFKLVHLENPELQISFSQYNTDVVINERNVDFITFVDVSIAGENETSLLKLDEEQRVVSDLWVMYDIANYYIYENIIADDNIPAGGLLEIAAKGGVDVAVTNYDSGVLMVSVFPISDVSYPRMFNFLHKPVGGSGSVDFGSSFADIGARFDDELNVSDFDELVL